MIMCACLTGRGETDRLCCGFEQKETKVTKAGTDGLAGKTRREGMRAES